MTVDYAAAALFFRDLGPYDMPVGGTAIGRALTAAKRLLERSSQHATNKEDQNQRSRVVILLTDGEDHEGDPIAAAEELDEDRRARVRGRHRHAHRRADPDLRRRRHLDRLHARRRAATRC